MSDSQSPAISVEGLYHSYKTHKALSGATFEVAQQTIHGFVGPNGAGKTTTLKVLATLIKPQTGRVRIFGFPVTRAYKEVRKRIGYMPDHFSSYRLMTVTEYLDFFAAAYGMLPPQRESTVKEVLDLTDLAGRREDLVQSLSRGMQQRLSLARVLVHDPKLLLLDEPASGLDPRARIELMEILKELCRLGKTIFISSHILSELADLCDSVTILDRGVVKFTGQMGDLLEQHGGAATYLLRLADASPEAAEAVEALAGTELLDVEQEHRALRVMLDTQQTSANQLLQAVIGAGGQVVSLAPDTRQLNQVFMALTEPGVGS